MRPATDQEMERWDELISANPNHGNVLQLKAFGTVKHRHGWEAKPLMMGHVAVLALSRHIPLLGEFWYIPNGPGVSDLQGLKAFAKELKTLPNKPFAVRIDPEIIKSEIQPANLAAIGFVPAPRNIQYNVSTVIVGLAPSEEEILSSFKQKTRYNVRLAAKKGVTVGAVETNDETISQMYELYRTTTKRAGVYLRSKQYFADFWRLHAESDTGQLFFAKYEGQLLAGAFITYVGAKALYKDGGSVRDHPEVQAPYALQWEIMRWLKERGVTSYDMHGVPPAAEIDNPKHPLAGLARFKTGFQPDVTEFIGTYDLPLDTKAYHRWLKWGERLAVTYEFRIKHRLFY